jgi:hypothetical protein
MQSITARDVAPAPHGCRCNTTLYSRRRSSAATLPWNTNQNVAACVQMFVHENQAERTSRCRLFSHSAALCNCVLAALDLTAAEFGDVRLVDMMPRRMYQPAVPRAATCTRATKLHAVHMHPKDSMARRLFTTCHVPAPDPRLQIGDGEPVSKLTPQKCNQVSSRRNLAGSVVLRFTFVNAIQRHSGTHPRGSLHVVRRVYRGRMWCWTYSTARSCDRL